MKVQAKQTVNDRLLDDNYHSSLSPGTIYHVVGIDDESFRVINDHGEPILYPKGLFDVVDPHVSPDWITRFRAEDDYDVDPAEFAVCGFYEDLFDHVPEAVEKFEAYRKLHGLPGLTRRRIMGH